jgi:hypothetical protein
MDIYAGDIATGAGGSIAGDGAVVWPERVEIGNKTPRITITNFMG